MMMMSGGGQEEGQLSANASLEYLGSEPNPLDAEFRRAILHFLATDYEVSECPPRRSTRS